MLIPTWFPSKFPSLIYKIKMSMCYFLSVKRIEGLVLFTIYRCDIRQCACGLRSSKQFKVPWIKYHFFLLFKLRNNLGLEVEDLIVLRAWLIWSRCWVKQWKYVVFYTLTHRSWCITVAGHTDQRVLIICFSLLFMSYVFCLFSFLVTHELWFFDRDWYPSFYVSRTFMHWWPLYWVM